MAALPARNAGRYQPPVRGKTRPIRQNVEKDSPGQCILRSGDCHKVIDDPSVGSRYAFLEFGQYVVMCTRRQREARELP